MRFDMDIFIDRESDTPLYIQIRQSVISAIEAEKLVPGDRLPPVALLAKDLGVTQATVRRALHDLSEKGYVESHVGRGTFVRTGEPQPLDDGAVSEHAREQFAPFDASTGKAALRPIEFAAKRLRAGVRQALVDIMPLARKPGMIQLTQGVPDGSLLPESFLEDITRQTLAPGSVPFIEATPETGMEELRSAIADRYSESGMDVAPDQVLITNGSLQAISLVAQAALEHRPGIICETPCFQGIADTFSALGHWVETVPRTTGGPTVEHLYNHAGKHILYLCPYAHNPTGTHLSAATSDALSTWAKKTDSVIIADELFKDLHFTGTAPPSLFKTLGDERTIVVSSLSKTVMTGLRLGWLISSRQRVRELAQHKRLTDHSAPALIQGLALTLFTSGIYDQHTQRMRAIYKERMDTLLGALSQLMPKDVHWSKPTGGFSLMLELPPGYSSVALLLAAIDKGVSFLPGPLFDIDHRYVHALRLSTAWSDKHQIREGIELLASAVEEILRHPPGDAGLSGLGAYQ